MLGQEWTGFEATALQSVTRSSVREFAARLGINPTAVTKWRNRGRTIRLRPDTQQLLDIELSRASDDEKAAFYQLIAAHPAHERLDDRVPSPEIGTNATVADAANPVDTRTPDGLRQRLISCQEDDGEHGSAAALVTVLGVLSRIHQRASAVGASQRQQLLSVGAEAAEFASWLYRDADQPGRAFFWLDRATEYAQAATDPVLEGYILLRKAQFAYDRRDPHHMLILAEAAHTRDWGLPHQVRAEATQQHARAEAMLGTSLDTVNRRLDRAWKLLETTATPDPRLGGHYTGALLTMQTALCYLEAGHPKRAVQLYDRALTTTAFSPRDYGFHLAWKARALALSGEPDHAATLAVDAVRRAAETNSRRTFTVVRELLTILEPWRYHPSVTTLREALAN
ncbi:hypothetical protein [Nocardia sp. NPDC051570]|uniref:hypothetical protein n=1 Tax=Nocardia sp. NPDC051570 TaxID=3364324 RepID=UPI0037A0D97C